MDVAGNDRCEHRENRKPRVQRRLRHEQYLNHTEFAIEPDGQRNTRQRKHAGQHDAGVQGIAAIQAAQIIQGFTFNAFA